MKNGTIITGFSIIAIFISGFVFISCSKQDNECLIQKDDTSKDYTVYYAFKGFADEVEVYKENPHYKSEEAVDVDSAIWLMEGAMNLTYGFPFEEYGEFTSGQSTLTMSKNQDGQLDMDEVALTFGEVVEQARQDYYGSGFEEKGLYVVNLEKTGETETDVTFSLETVTGNKGIDPYPFNYGDNWWSGDDEGGCAGNNASSSDAAHELAAKYPTQYPDQYTVLAGPKSVTVTGGEGWLRRPNDPLDNLYDYYIFCVNDSVNPFNYDNDRCLLANEMSNYYWLLDYVITDLARVHFSIPYTHIFINFTNSEGYSIYNQQYDFTKYIHDFDLFYAMPKDKPAGETPIEL